MKGRLRPGQSLTSSSAKARRSWVAVERPGGSRGRAASGSRGRAHHLICALCAESGDRQPLALIDGSGVSLPAHNVAAPVEA